MIKFKKFFIYKFLAINIIVLIFFSAGCSSFIKVTPESNGLSLQKVNFYNIPSWEDDNHGYALAAFKKSCSVLLHQPFKNLVIDDIIKYKVNWSGACKIALEMDHRNHHEAKMFFENWFVPYSISDGFSEEGLFTGYYEPEIRGSLTPSEIFRVPLYGLPSDLVFLNLSQFSDDLTNKRIVGRLDGSNFVPYFKREEIESGIEQLKGLEIAWIEDPVDAFFLHIQGSGRILFDDGSSKRIGYAGSNGHKYYAIGRKLIANGQIPKHEMSMQSIRKWLKENPSNAQDLINENPSYIFFKWNNELDTTLGPIGAQGVSLTEGRSLAIDRRYFTFGLPIWIETKLPEVNSIEKKDISRLVVAQDTGGAIRGIVRGDLFIGSGNKAGLIAGRMKETGRYWVLLPK